MVFAELFLVWAEEGLGRGVGRSCSNGGRGGSGNKEVGKEVLCRARVLVGGYCGRRRATS